MTRAPHTDTAPSRFSRALSGLEPGRSPSSPVDPNHLMSKDFQLLIGVALALSGLSCSHLRAPEIQVEGDTAVHSLRVSPTEQGPPTFTLHWEVSGLRSLPSGFEVYNAPEPLTETNMAGFLVATAQGTDRNHPVTLDPNSGIRYLVVKVVGGDSAGSALSRTLPLDTGSKLVYQAEGLGGRQLWVSNGGGTPAQITGDGENFNWTPGSRSLVYIDGGTGRPEISADLTWPSDLSFAQSEISLPDVVLPADWFSMRVSGDGLVAYRTTGVGDVALHVRDQSGTAVRVSGFGPDVRQFAWSPNGQELIYLQDGVGLNKHLYAVRANGSGRVRLNPDLGEDDYVLLADWSPTSRYIAFHVIDASASESGSLYLHDRETGRTDYIAHEAGHELSWSPNGSHLLFVTTIPVGTPPQFPSKPLTVAILEIGDENRVSTPLTRWEDLYGFAWSPDGMKTAFITDPGGTVDPRRIEVWDLFAKDMRPFLPFPIEEDVIQFRWSPDSKFIASVVHQTQAQLIRVHDLSDGFSAAPSSIWIGGRTIGPIAWSPLGGTLACVKFDGVQSNLFVVDGVSETLISIGLQANRAVVDFRWSDWAMPLRTWIYSTLVSK